MKFKNIKCVSQPHYNANSRIMKFKEEDLKNLLFSTSKINQPKKFKQ